MAPLPLRTIPRARAKVLVGNNRGQVLVEGVLVIPVLILALTALLYLSYHGLCYFYASYHLEEALICMTESRQRPACERELRQGIMASLLFHENVRVRLESSPDKITGRVEIDLKQKLNLEKNLKLPLEKNL